MNDKELLKLAFYNGMEKQAAALTTFAIISAIGALISGAVPPIVEYFSGGGLEGRAEKFIKQHPDIIESMMPKGIKMLIQPLPYLKDIPGIGQYINPLTLTGAGGLGLLWYNNRKMNKLKKKSKKQEDMLNKILQQNENLLDNQDIINSRLSNINSNRIEQRRPIQPMQPQNFIERFEG